MPKNKIVSIIAVFITFMLTMPLQAQPMKQADPEPPAPRPKSSSTPTDFSQARVDEWEEKSRQAYAEGNHVRYYSANMKLHVLRPYEPSYLEHIIAACALVGRPRTAYHYLLQMQQQGFARDLNLNPDTESIRDTELWEYLTNLMAEARQANGNGENVFELPRGAVGPAAISWDESRDSFLVGTEEDGIIYSVSKDGKAEKLIEANDDNGLWAIRGLHADHENNRLWVSSAAVPVFSGFQPTDKGRGALFEFDLKTLELKGRFNLPVDGLTHELGPMAVTRDGLVYIVDLAQPIVFRKTADGDQLDVFLAVPGLVALTDLAVTPDNSRLFLADRALGIMVVDPAMETSSMIRGPEKLNMGAISGLFYENGQLVMIQNGFEPDRIIRLELDAAGATVSKIIPLAVALEPFDRPAFGTIKDGNIYYFANPRGMSDDKKKSRVVVMKTPLDPGDSYVDPEMLDIRKQIKQKQQ